MKQKNEFNVPPPSEDGTRELRKEIQKMKRDNRFLRMRLATNMARKQVLQDTLRNTAALVRQVGQTPVVNASDATSKTMYGLTACARSCGSSLGRLYKWLQYEGVMHREGDLWVIDEPYQDKDYFFYLFGLRNCFSRLYLRVTPKGLELIREILTRHPIEIRYFKKTKNN